MLLIDEIEDLQLLLDVGNFEKWLKVAFSTTENIEIFSMKIRDCVKNRTALIDPTAHIHPTAVLEDDVIIANNVFIGPHSYIGEHSMILSGTKIGYNVEIIKTIIMKNSKILHTACIGNSIIGNCCNIGAGLIVATRRLDNKKIKIKGPSNTHFYSKRSHYGVIIGSNTQIGVQVTTMPGAVIGENALIYPCSIVSGFIEPNFVGYVDASWGKRK